MHDAKLEIKSTREKILVLCSGPKLRVAIVALIWPKMAKLAIVKFRDLREGGGLTVQFQNILLLSQTFKDLTNFLLHTISITSSNGAIWIEVIVRNRICSYPSVLIIYNHFHTVTPIVFHICFSPINRLTVRFEGWIISFKKRLRMVKCFPHICDP